MITSNIKNIHWSYYLSFERDIENIARYIDFDKSNFCTHSIELARILLAASSEVDVLLNEICKYIEPNSNPRNIDQYRKIILNNTPNLLTHDILGRRYGLRLKPWLDWENNKNPEWWWAYNKVKHDRSNYFQQANLVNTLNSVAALLVLNIKYAYYLMKPKDSEFPYELRNVIGDLYPKSELFRIDDKFVYLRD